MDFSGSPEEIGHPTSIAISKECEYTAIGYQYGTIKVFDSKTGMFLSSSKYILFVEISLIFSYHTFPFLLRFVSFMLRIVFLGVTTRTYSQHSGRVGALTFSMTDSFLVSGADDASVLVVSILKNS